MNFIIRLKLQIKIAISVVVIMFALSPQMAKAQLGNCHLHIDAIHIDDLFEIKMMPIFFKSDIINIKYNPTNFAMQNLSDYQQFKNGTLRENILPQVPTLAQIRHAYSIENPDSIKYTWSMIPEPWRSIREGRKIHHDSDYDNLAKIFESAGYSEDDTDYKLLPEKEKSPWTISGEENVQLSQLYVDNWVKGGESSMTLLSDLRFSAIYSKNKHQWENNITHKLGVTHTSVLGTRLSDDVIDLSSKYGYKAVNKWYYSFQNTFKTQLFRNYSKSDTEKETPTSALLSPAYVQFIIGMDFKKENLSLLLSPFTSIMTIVVDTATIDQTTYSVKENKKTMSVNGFSVTANWKVKVFLNTIYSTKCELFYEYFQKGGQKRFDWENVFDMQINRFLATRLLFELRYYDNESKKFQVKENVSVAFKYSF